MATWDEGEGVVELSAGRRVRGRGLRHPLPSGPTPEFGVYFLSKDPGPFEWDYRWVRCPDFRTPTSEDEAIAASIEAFDRAADQRVEVGCGGGVGRTGLVLSMLAIMSGVPQEDAVAWVRQRYHPRAVETPWQRRWVRRLKI